MTNADLEPVDPGELDRPSLKHFGALVRELEHFLVADGRQPPRFGHEARVGGVHAVDVRVDVAALGTERDRQGDGARIRAAAAERRDLVAGGALEACDDHDAAVVQLLTDPGRLDAGDARAAERAVGQDARLRPGQADRVNAPVMQGHDEQRRADQLARGHQQVQLARIGRLRDLLPQARSDRRWCRPSPKQRRRVTRPGRAGPRCDRRSGQCHRRGETRAAVLGDNRGRNGVFGTPSPDDVTPESQTRLRAGLRRSKPRAASVHAR